MNRHFHKAEAMLRAAKPASGFRPQTQAEWLALLKAHEEKMYAVLRTAGQPAAQARAMAHAIYGGAAGLMLLDIAFKE